MKLTGEAVKSLTVMFLEIWNLTEKYQEDYGPYLKDVTYRAEEQGFVCPIHPPLGRHGKLPYHLVTDNQIWGGGIKIMLCLLDYIQIYIFPHSLLHGTVRIGADKSLSGAKCLTL